MVAARLTSLAADVQERVWLEDPEYLSAMYRLARAAQETADEEKRERLAAALANSGSWSTLPVDDRERMELLVIELTSREVALLEILAAPEDWLTATNPSAVAGYRTSGGAVQQFLDNEVAKNLRTEQAAIRSVVESLELRGLVSIPKASLSGQGIFDSRATGLGWELVHYLRGIGA